MSVLRLTSDMGCDRVRGTVTRRRRGAERPSPQHAVVRLNLHRGEVAHAQNVAIALRTMHFGVLCDGRADRYEAFGFRTGVPNLENDADLCEWDWCARLGIIDLEAAASVRCDQVAHERDRDGRRESDETAHERHIKYKVVGRGPWLVPDCRSLRRWSEHRP